MAEHADPIQGIETTEAQIPSDGMQLVIPDGLHPNYEEKHFVSAESRNPEPPYRDSVPPYRDSILTAANPNHRRRKVITSSVLILIIVVVVSIPTGLEVSKNKRIGVNTAAGSENVNATASIPISSTVTPAPVPSNPLGNILQGTRLTTMWPGTGGDIYLFYQWDDRSLRYIGQSPERVWQGSTDIHVNDAKLRTPLAAFGTGPKDIVYIWWLFFVDGANVIQNIYSYKDAATWQRGNIGSYNYKVPNSTNIAFTVTHGRMYNQTTDSMGGGLSLYASAENGVIQEYIFDDRDWSWNNGFTFPNTDGLGGASTWSIGPAAFVFTSSSDQSLELWYRDYNSSSQAGNNRWKLGPVSQASLAANGSVCGFGGIAYQASSGMIQGSTFSQFQDPALTRWGTIYNISAQAAIDGSSVSCFFFGPFWDVNPNIMNQIFYQVEGNEIQEAIRTWGQDNQTVPGNWTYSTVPIKPG